MSFLPLYKNQYLKEDQIRINDFLTEIYLHRIKSALHWFFKSHASYSLFFFIPSYSSFLRMVAGICYFFIVESYTVI